MAMEQPKSKILSTDTETAIKDPPANCRSTDLVPTEATHTDIETPTGSTITTEVDINIAAQDTVKSHIALQDRTITQRGVNGDVAPTTTVNANSVPFPDEIFFEPPDLTAEVTAILAKPCDGLDQQLIFRFISLASNHLEIHSTTSENGVQNSCSMYNHLLDSAKELRAQQAECNEILYALGTLKHNISTGKGISAQIVRQWAQQMVNAIKASEQSS